MDSSNNDDLKLHIVMFPWLAMGHLIPFLELSKHFAQKGHRVSFISTPRNIERLPKIPPNLSPLIDLVTVSLPRVDNLPQNAESSIDIPNHKSQFLKKAFDGLQAPLTSLLQDCNPDWIIYDYASYWLPGVAAKLGVPCAFFSLFSASCMAFIGPPSLLLSESQDVWPVDLTVVPSWIPFPSDVVFRPHEVLRIKDSAGGNESGVSDFIRFGTAIRDGDAVIFRSSVELESKFLSILEELYKKPIIPIGFLPPSVQDDDKEEDPSWGLMKEWLDKQELDSAVYVAMGSEATLSREQINELAVGLELSHLPFFWVLRRQPGSVNDMSEMLPEGFQARIGDRGFVYVGWAPQVKILSHRSVGGVVTHCGWNSVIEGLAFGRALILLPMINDQGLNARLLEGKKLGLEIPRNEKDGWFTSESVAESVRTVMVEKEGEFLRINAKAMRKVFGDENVNGRLVDSFIRYLGERRRCSKEKAVSIRQHD